MIVIDVTMDDLYEARQIHFCQPDKIADLEHMTGRRTYP